MWTESLTIYNPAQDINDMLEAEEQDNKDIPYEDKKIVKISF